MPWRLGLKKVLWLIIYYSLGLLRAAVFINFQGLSEGPGNFMVFFVGASGRRTRPGVQEILAIDWPLCSSLIESRRISFRVSSASLRVEHGWYRIRESSTSSVVCCPASSSIIHLKWITSSVASVAANRSAVLVFLATLLISYEHRCIAWSSHFLLRKIRIPIQTLVFSPSYLIDASDIASNRNWFPSTSGLKETTASWAL